MSSSTRQEWVHWNQILQRARKGRGWMEHTELEERIRAVFVHPGEKRHWANLIAICSHVVGRCGEGNRCFLERIRAGQQAKNTAGVWGILTKWNKDWLRNKSFHNESSQIWTRVQRICWTSFLGAMQNAYTRFRANTEPTIPCPEYQLDPEITRGLSHLSESKCLWAFWGLMQTSALFY